MQHFIRKKNYKAAAPYDTIRNIREILFRCDIFLKEKTCTHEDSGTTAVMLQFGDDCFRNIPIGTNGKGMNSRYALASAYGEMIERLQCQILLRHYRRKAFAQGDISFLYAPDEKMLPFHEVMEECGDLLRVFLNVSDDTFDALFSPLADLKTLCLPYYDVLHQKTVMFPYELLSGKINSNGMCSGNTPQEALNQGISELYERQALMLIYRDNPIIPSLPEEMFAGSEILSRLNALERLGFGCDILDCSMGSEFPVIGLRLTCEAGKLINLGADPDPIVALERCLTEQYQITDPQKLKGRFSSESCGLRTDMIYDFLEDYYHSQLIRCKKYGSGKKPDNIFYPSGITSKHFSCKEDPQQSDYDYLKELIRKNGHHLLIRNCSWLGFPSYICFSPELSMADYMYENAAATLAKILENGRKVPDPEGYEDVLPILKRLDDICMKHPLQQELF